MDLSDKLKTLPKKPGCYQMKDKDGNIIYVGKAINLKNRVNSYFIGAHDYKTTKLVSNIADFDYILTKSEKEALILEYNLIKKYSPRYNIIFMDDKTYPYILLKDCKEPYLSVVRLTKKNKPKGKLYGPFPGAGAARNTVDLINRLFPTRKCEKLGDELCLYYHMHACPGYCKKDVDQEESDKIKKSILSFLNGNTNVIIRNLKKEMNECVSRLDYEKAAYYRDLINDINVSCLRQDVQKNNRESFDVFNYAAAEGFIAITGLFIKAGKLLSSDKHLDYLIGDIENYVTSYIYQFYEVNEKPKKLYVPPNLLPYLKDAIADVEVLASNRGHKYQLLKQAKENSEENLKSNRAIITRNDSYYEEIDNEFAKIFHRKIKRIEIFDNSHTGGTNTVSGMVVYENFKPLKKEYRLFKLQEGADDISSMKEALYRHYFRIFNENLKRPDLLLVDGARNQIEAAKEIIDGLGLDIMICGLVKDSHHNTAHLMDSNFNIIDIQQESNLFFFLTNIQDEVHRFAISYHKKLRQKAMYKSVLDDIKGLGPKSRNKLLRKYKSIANLRTVSLEELQTVLNKKTAEALYNKLRKNDDKES